MTNKFSVERLADDIQHKRKNTKTAAFFKSIILKKLKGIKVGQLTIVDGSSTLVYGDKDSKLQATITVTSQEFYVFLGSGGALGAAEAYTAGYWLADNLVGLVQIMIKNKKIMGKIPVNTLKKLFDFGYHTRKINVIFSRVLRKK